MGTPSSRKLELALRKNKGRLLRPKWTRALKEASGFMATPQDFLSLEETETMKAAFLNASRSQGVLRRYRNKGELSAITASIRRLSHDAGSIPVLLFSRVDDVLGAVCLPAAPVLNHPTSVWKVVGEDLCIATTDMGTGLRVETNFYHEDGAYVKTGFYELSAWGRFSEAAA
mgnify:CR=1 FL=1